MADENIVDEVVDTKTVVDDAKPADTTVVTDLPEGTTSPAPGTKPAATGEWPADWRDKFSGGDAQKAARLQRYASPQALTDALIAAQNKIRAGDLKPALGKDAKPEEIAAFREAHGIPEAPDKYDLGDVEVPESDKELVNKFLASAHTVNMTPEQVRTTLKAYNEISEAARNARMAQDVEIKTTTEDALRAEWGDDFRTNINLVTNLLDTAPAGLREKLLQGRLSDGTPIGSSPEALRFLVGLARERNPAGVVTPSGVATAQSVEDEIQKIETLMRNDRAAYNRDNKLQARYRQLLGWRAQQSAA